MCSAAEQKMLVRDRAAAHGRCCLKTQKFAPRCLCKGQHRDQRTAARRAVSADAVSAGARPTPCARAVCGHPRAARQR